MLIIDFISAFIKAIFSTGITPPKEIINDGQIHRFSSNGKSGDKSGYYAFFSHPNGFNAGFFGCWRTGLYSTWSSKHDLAMTEFERDVLEQCKKEAKRARQKVHQNRAAYAAEVWEKAQKSPAEHRYISSKQLKNTKGIAYMPSISCSDFFIDESRTSYLHDTLIIPVYDAEGIIQSLQAIMPDGKKFFMKGGKMTEGRMTIEGDKETIYVCEGYATGMSLHNMTNATIVVTFNASNLETVAPSLKESYSDSIVIVAADNDHIKEKERKGNKGIEVAKKLLEQHRLPYTYPSFDDGDNGTDWNDFSCNHSAETVLAELETNLVEPLAVFDSYDACLQALQENQDDEHAFNSAITMIKDSPRLKHTRMRNQLKEVSGAEIGDIRAAIADAHKAEEVPDLTHGQIADDYISKRAKPGPVGVYGKVWEYQPEQGIWSDTELSTIGVVLAKDYAHEAMCKRGSDYRATGLHVYDSVANEEYFNDVPSGLHTPSGFIYAEGKELKKSCASPDHRARFRLEVEPNFEKEPTKFLLMLREAFAGEHPEEQIRQLQMFIGMTLLGLLPQEQRVVLLVGEAGSGKSVCLRVLESLVPSRFRTSISPLDLDSDYKVAALAGKLVNLVPEIDKHKPIPSAQFKAITGGDTVSAREPYGKVFSFTPNTACWFNGNFFPTTKDYTEGFWRRWGIIKFANTKPAHLRNPKLYHEIIAEELSAILGWALVGAKDYLDNGLYLSPAHYKALAKWKNNGNSVASWLQDEEDNRIGRREQGTGKQPLKVTHAYVIYKEWCQHNNRKPFNKQEFKEQMLLQGYPSGVYSGYACYTALYDTRPTSLGIDITI